MRRENKFICPTIVNVFCDETELSTARIDVVPTVQNTFFRFCTVYNITSFLSDFNPQNPFYA
jgi:hypothetical protein